MRKLKYVFAYTVLAAYLVAGTLLALGACGYTWAQQILLSLV